MAGVCLSRPFQIQHTPEHEALPKSLHFYLRMLENIFSYGIQVRGILDVADIVSHSLDHHIARWQDQLVGPDLRKKHICQYTNSKHRAQKLQVMLSLEGPAYYQFVSSCP